MAMVFILQPCRASIRAPNSSTPRLLQQRFRNSRITPTKLNELVQAPAFLSILKAIREYAIAANVPEEQAAEEIVQTFRRIDTVWDDYIFQEGLDKLQGHLSN